MPVRMENNDQRPENCRNRLRDEGEAYPKSGCESCGTGGLTGCPHAQDTSNSQDDDVPVVQNEVPSNELKIHMDCVGCEIDFRLRGETDEDCEECGGDGYYYDTMTFPVNEDGRNELLDIITESGILARDGKEAQRIADKLIAKGWHKNE